MCGMLDSYLDAFSKLRTDKNQKSWPECTYHRSPYKHKVFFFSAK